MDRFEDLLFGILNNNRELSDLVGRDTVGDYTIDTCYTIDQGYETAVNSVASINSIIANSVSTN